MAAKLLEPIHPGEILYEEFMKPMGVSINAFAREIAVPPNRISDSTNPMRGFGAGCGGVMSMISTLTRTACLLFSTDDSMATPCSVNAYGAYFACLPRP